MRNRIIRFIGICATLFLTIFSAKSQDSTLVWNLSKCIDYAREQNISILKSKISYEESLINTKAAKGAYLPSLSFSTGYTYSYAPFVEANDKSNFGGQYNLGASWTVYDGTRKKNVKQSELSNMVAELSTAITENSVIEAISNAYVNILYANETVKTRENSVSVSKAQVDRAEEMLNVGSISKSDYAQLSSQYSDAKYQLVSAQASLDNMKLQLKQLLELGGDVTVEIDIPEYNDDDILIALPTKQYVFEQALAVRPEIQSSKLSIDNASMNVEIAKAGYLPNISLSASSGINHGNNSIYPFFEQVGRSWNNSVGISLSVPILDKRQTKSSVEKAQLQVKSSELDYIDEEKTLYQTIESLWLDASSSQERFRAAIEKLSAAEISYNLIEEQFNLGMKNTTELLTERNSYISAQQEVIQSKYMAILSLMLLDIYQGKYNN
ncbi:MAG: TolC family protein [Bacteroidales bacterium]|nr:TolC family protein [Bacteroidales bacterium]